MLRNKWNKTRRLSHLRSSWRVLGMNNSGSSELARRGILRVGRQYALCCHSPGNSPISSGNTETQDTHWSLEGGECLIRRVYELHRTSSCKSGYARLRNPCLLFTTYCMHVYRNEAHIICTTNAKERTRSVGR
jgi:hypothetical protein